MSVLCFQIPAFRNVGEYEFDDLHIRPDILQIIKEMGIEKPTRIQVNDISYMYCICILTPVNFMISISFGELCAICWHRSVEEGQGSCLPCGQGPTRLKSELDAQEKSGCIFGILSFFVKGILSDTVTVC